MVKNIIHSTPFEVFGLPIAYDIQNIDNEFYKLQKLYHPDSLGQSSELKAQNSSHVNYCYKLLKHPLKRAEWILKYFGIDTAKTPSAETVSETLEIREYALEYSVDDTLQMLKTIKAKKLLDLQDFFAKKLYENAFEVYTALKFIEKFESELNEII